MSEVSVSVIEPTTFQESDWAFTAFVHSAISDNHSSNLKEKELRDGVAIPRRDGVTIPSSATLLLDASTSESKTVATSNSRSAFWNFPTISSCIPACSGGMKSQTLTVRTIISQQTCVRMRRDIFFAPNIEIHISVIRSTRE